ncbi:MAG: hypothetical protein ABIT76_08225 [Chthoniobacterales bacterium]
MATPNYSFEKRRRDLEKKAKKEQKRLDKLAAKAAGTSGLSDGETEPAEGEEAADDEETGEKKTEE